MEIPPPTQNSEPTPISSDAEHDNSVSNLSDANGGGESDHKLSAEEVKGVLEIIASSGKFWNDWDELKSMLFFQLKQVLSEYPEARIPEDQPNSSLEESYLQLVKSLEEALFGFIEGPPFTLQRLCEILLNAQTIYPNLSKLALALEKNLLVTSTLTKSTDPYPPTMEQRVDDSEQIEDAEPLPQPETQPQPQSPPHSNPLENGGELITGEDKDEVMSAVDAAEADDGMAIDMETFEEIISSSSETSNNPQTSNS